MLIQIHPLNPQPRLIRMVADCLTNGGVIIYPTDTIYGLGCDIRQQKAVERICKIKNVDPPKAQLSFICRDLSNLSDYTKSIDTPLYRLLKSYLPGREALSMGWPSSSRICWQMVLSGTRKPMVCFLFCNILGTCLLAGKIKV